MNKLNQIMLYVNNQDVIANFWVDNFGFKIEGREDYGMSFAIVLSDGRQNSTRLVLQNRAVVAAANPEMNLGTPSILLTTNDIEELYAKLKDRKITLGDKVAFPNGKKVFNFADPEGNYFAIIEE